MINWGLVANGTYIPGIDKVPENIYYKSVPDPEHPDRTILDIVGIEKENSERVNLPVIKRWHTLLDGES